MRFIWVLSILLIVFVLVGCIPAPTPMPLATYPPGFYNAMAARQTVIPKLTALAAAASGQTGSLRQWASQAEAVVAASDPRYAADHAAGAPDFYPK
jgi:hypothetical protein